MAARDQVRRPPARRRPRRSRRLRLLSRNGYDRRGLFDAPFAELARLGRDMVLDGQIAVSDGQGCTHLEDLY
jgi:hypothetical protein